jgi:hypothetical protein
MNKNSEIQAPYSMGESEFFLNPVVIQPALKSWFEYPTGLSLNKNQ